MSSRRRPGISAAAFVSHTGVMIAVAALVGVLVAGIAIPFVAVAGLGARATADSMDNLPRSLTTQPLAQRTRVLAADGSLLATWYQQNRINVPLDKVAMIMRKAILSIEDYRFYDHGALDLKGTLRALVTNQASGGVVQGGSSITQQMVKQTLINQAGEDKKKIAAAQADTFERKFRELQYAIAFEQKYSKDWILERYLNVSYFGDGVYGIDAAARHYFHRPAAALKLRQAALLAGIVKNPTDYDPTNDPAQARQRRNVVLGRMAELNVISRSEARKASKRSLGLRVSSTRNGCVGTNGEFFCDYVREYLLADPALGATVTDRKRLLNGGGLTIQTTLDPRMQRAADTAVANHVKATDQAIGGLAMVQPGTGQVRAIAQSRPMGSNRAKGQTFLNYVVPRQYGDANGFQAGSTFKAFVLAAAIDQKTPLNTRIPAPPTIQIRPDQLRTCDGTLQSNDVWTVGNSTGKETSYDLYSGTQNSINTFYAQLEVRTGLCEPVTLAREMGVIVPESDVVGPFTLGVTDTNPVTMASAYATFAARGEYCEPHPVTSVTTSTGKVLVDYPDKCKRLFPDYVGDAVNDILRGVQEPGGFGYSNGLQLNQPSAAKTGTIQENRAVWYVGYTPNMATAAMLAGANSLGHPITLNGQTVGGQTITEAFGSTQAGPIWGDAMHAVESILPDTDFVKPDPTSVAGQPVTVPSIGGRSTADAATQLRQLGLTPSVGPSVNSSYPAGTVAYTSPGSGTVASTGTPVTIYVSNGVPVPPGNQGGGGGGGRKNNGGGNGGGGGGGGGNGRGGGR